ncbi:hypothetical protein BU15DRAFT_58903 [Melanogaster broomeanus]|nr:hypothetical protein BU15DRAFT_58903 [Melanogaster broomeanus]
MNDGLRTRQHGWRSLRQQSPHLDIDGCGTLAKRGRKGGEIIEGYEFIVALLVLHVQPAPSARDDPGIRLPDFVLDGWAPLRWGPAWHTSWLLNWGVWGEAGEDAAGQAARAALMRLTIRGGRGDGDGRIQIHLSNYVFDQHNESRGIDILHPVMESNAFGGAVNRSMIAVPSTRVECKAEAAGSQVALGTTLFLWKGKSGASSHWSVVNREMLGSITFANVSQLLSMTEHPFHSQGIITITWRAK